MQEQIDGQSQAMRQYISMQDLSRQKADDIQSDNF